jgi:pyridoxamine 5'-phosphate oxidase
LYFYYDHVIYVIIYAQVHTETPMSLHPNIADLRRNYTLAGLSESDVAASPTDQFRRWFDEAIAAQLATEANAMTLATATPAGKPSARIVLLKGFDERGFVWFTNYESRKAAELAANPHACLVFFWPELERQVRIDGSVAKVSEDETAEYFHTRPIGSRIGAWASHQSSVIQHREELEARFQELSEQYRDGNVPVPPHWGGYRLAPTAFEFWQGRPSRLHDRLRYTPAPQGWTIERLSP